MEKGTVKYDIPGNVTVYISDAGISFKPRKSEEVADFCIPLSFGENIISPISYRILIATDKKVAEEWQNIYKSSILTSVNFDKITNDGEIKLFVRNRRPKDKYTFGKISRDVRRQLINFKIPSETRDTLPVICCENEIVLVHGLPTSDKFRTEKNGKAVYLVCTPDNNNI
jgi:tRNA(Ile)-lysidine synthetase-like protein